MEWVLKIVWGSCHTLMLSNSKCSQSFGFDNFYDGKGTGAISLYYQCKKDINSKQQMVNESGWIMEWSISVIKERVMRYDYII